MTEKMQDDVLENYVKAGKIASQVREEARSFVKPGMTLLSIAERIESRIKELGGEIAFPVNLSINDLAAHYTPYRNDTLVLGEDVIKIDIGVHVDGYVADTAMTLSFNEEEKEKCDNLIKASKEALENAIEKVKPGALLSDISSAIEETIKSHGFNPVSNLTGHGIDRFNLHDQPQVPNVKFKSDYRLPEDKVIAIEPFATTGVGRIKETEPTLIYMMLREGNARNTDGRVILKHASEFGGLPFAERWLPIESRVKIKIAMRELVSRGLIYEYPPLKEISSGLVSQAEHTIIVGEEPIVTTK